MNQAFLDYYRCPEEFADFSLSEGPATDGAGYFRFGPDLICYGKAAVQVQPEVNEALPDAMSEVRARGGACVLPFDPTEIATNLRYERYVQGETKSSWQNLAHHLYYFVRPCLPVSVRRHLQRTWLNGWKKKIFPRWPVDRSVDQLFQRLMSLSLQDRRATRVPFVWFWPEGMSSCAIMTHDIETEAGLDFAGELMDINDSFGIKSSFQVIPEWRYSASAESLEAIRKRGFELNVHDLRHDGYLFQDHEQFQGLAARVNQHVSRFGSKGFRSAVLYRNLDWYGAFSFSYDMSVPNVGHLDPQPGGCCTVMPYFVGKIVELPLTTIQDYSLFNILGTYSLDLWRQQIHDIMEHHGLMSFNIHPDYLDSDEAKDLYRALLKHVSELRDSAQVWIPLPGEVDSWWRERSQMKLVSAGEGWRIEGKGAERARIAYASIHDGQLAYSFN